MTARQIQDARHREVVSAYYATGDESQLGTVLADLRPRLLDFLKGKNLQDPGQRADLVQEALVTILTGLRAHKYSGTGSLTSWALTVCWHCFTASYNNNKSKPSQPGLDENPFLLLPASVATPAEELPISEEEEQRAGSVVAAATHAVLGLEPTARLCVLLTYYQGLSVAAAASQLGLTKPAFRARLRQGLADLQAWGQRHAYLAPAPEIYAALPRLRSGNLFREPLCLAS